LQVAAVAVLEQELTVVQAVAVVILLIPQHMLVVLETLLRVLLEVLVGMYLVSMKVEAVAVVHLQ
jgi:hypothetical protein